MASTARPSFTFHLAQSPSSSSSPRSKSHVTYLPRPYTISPPQKHPKPHFILTSKSVDVSKDDKPISDSEPGEETDTNIDSFDKRRLEEKFAVLNTGIYECRSCGYLYNEATGDPSYPIPPGMTFKRLPEDWRCPTCGAAQSFFESKSVEIAGFAENQQFGLGGNSLTSGQKGFLIYGSLLFFFILFLSGYFLQ